MIPLQVSLPGVQSSLTIVTEGDLKALTAPAECTIGYDLFSGWPYTIAPQAASAAICSQETVVLTIPAETRYLLSGKHTNIAASSRL